MGFNELNNGIVFNGCTAKDYSNSGLIYTPYVPLQVVNLNFEWDMQFDVKMNIDTSYKTSIEELTDYINEGPL